MSSVLIVIVLIFIIVAALFLFEPVKTARGVEAERKAKRWFMYRK